MPIGLQANSNDAGRFFPATLQGKFKDILMQIFIVNETYFVNDANQIGRPSIKMAPSKDWILTGAVELKMVFGSLTAIRHYSVWDIRNKIVPWFFKNGGQRCFITDEDHGYSRVQMSPRLLAVHV
jgi:hypothetical protein